MIYYKIRNFAANIEVFTKIMITMKTISRLLAALLVCAISTNANAQKRDVGEWSIIPKVGVNLAK